MSFSRVSAVIRVVLPIAFLILRSVKNVVIFWHTRGIYLNIFKYIYTYTSSCDDENLNRLIIFCIFSNSSFYCLPVTIVRRLPLWCGVCQDLCNIALHLNSKVSIWSQVTSSAIILYTPVRILFKLFLLLIIAVFRLLNWS